MPKQSTTTKPTSSPGARSKQRAQEKARRARERAWREQEVYGTWEPTADQLTRFEAMLLSLWGSPSFPGVSGPTLGEGRASYVQLCETWADDVLLAAVGADSKHRDTVACRLNVAESYALEFQEHRLHAALARRWLDLALHDLTEEGPAGPRLAWRGRRANPSFWRTPQGLRWLTEWRVGRFYVSPDFHNVVFGREYRFTPEQANIFRALCRARVARRDKLDTAAVWQNLEGPKPSRETFRVKPYFRSKGGTMHPAWGELIHSDGRGSYWVSPDLPLAVIERALQS